MSGGSGWISGKGSSASVAEQSPQGSGHSAKAARVQQAFRQCSQAFGVTLGDGPVQAWQLDSMILMSPFPPQHVIPKAPDFISREIQVPTLSVANPLPPLHLGHLFRHRPQLNKPCNISSTPGLRSNHAVLGLEY